MRITVNQYGIASALLFLGIIGLTMFAGIWESTPTVASMTDTTTGKINPDTIRGSMTFDEVAKVSGIPFERMAEELSLPANVTSEMKLKDVQQFIVGWETEVVREYMRNKSADK